jgi:hypothetical protein
VGFYRDQVLPRVIDRVCGTAELMRWRGQVAAGLAGEVVEIGFGSGLNVGAYPSEVRLVHAVEPAATARKIAQRRIEAAPFPVVHVGLRGESIPLTDGSCDAALCTFTL